MRQRKQIRLRKYDYSNEGMYFVTVCVHDRKCLFGVINGGVMNLNHTGEMVDSIWHEMPNYYKHIKLDAFVIMPNHIHGVIYVGEGPRALPNNGYMVDNGPARGPAPTDMMKKLSVSDYIQRFKSLSTALYRKDCLKNGLDFDGKLWQRSFHDRIIRNDQELNAYRKYIINNPLQEDLDPENINVTTS